MIYILQRCIKLGLWEIADLENFSLELIQVSFFTKVIMKQKLRKGPLILRNNPTLLQGDPTDLSRITDATKAWIQTLCLTTARAGTEIESVFQPLCPGLQHVPEEHHGVGSEVALYTKDRCSKTLTLACQIFSRISCWHFSRALKVQWNGMGLIGLIINY